jgi:hypothetical protein
MRSAPLFKTAANLKQIALGVPLRALKLGGLIYLWFAKCSATGSKLLLRG